jgi:hypothetical protein
LFGLRLCTLADVAHCRSRPSSDSGWSLPDRARCRLSSKRRNPLGGRFFGILSERGAVRAWRLSVDGVAQGSPAQRLRDAPCVTSTSRRGTAW